MKKYAVCFVCVMVSFCTSCNVQKEFVSKQIIEDFKYDITDGTLISVEKGDGVWMSDPFIVAADSIAILAYSGNDGWQLREDQQLGINCHLENFSEDTIGKFFIGNIANGQQNSAIPVDDEHLGISLSFGAAGEYYIYFMNTSAEDITVSDFEVWTQNEGEMDKYIF